MSALLALCSDAALLAGISICPAVKSQPVKSPMLLLAVAWNLFWPHHGKGLVKKILHNKPINHGHQHKSTVTARSGATSGIHLRSKSHSNDSPSLLGDCRGGASGTPPAAAISSTLDLLLHVCATPASRKVAMRSDGAQSTQPNSCTQQHGGNI